MKKFISFILTLAIILTGVAVPGNIVNAATKGLYYGYDTYEDYVEGMGLGAGASKKAVTDLSPMPSGVNENGEFTYFTYAELATSMGFVIPTDCSKILVDAGGTTYVGYKLDGSKFIIVKSDGYDNFGYDKNGYNRWGYDVNGYDKNGYDKNGYDRNGYDENGKKRDEEDNTTSKSSSGLHVTFESCIRSEITNTSKTVYISHRPDSKKQFNVDVEYFEGDKDYTIAKKNYTVKTEKVSVGKDGCGTYNVTVKSSGKYKATWSAKVVVIPQFIVSADASIEKKKTVFYTNFNIPYENKNMKDSYGIMYEIYKSTKTKTITFQGRKVKVPVINNTSDKLVKKGKTSVRNKYKTLLTINKKCKPGEWYYIKYRTYMSVNGEKVCSDWILGNAEYMVKSYNKMVITDENSVWVNVPYCL